MSIIVSRLKRGVVDLISCNSQLTSPDQLGIILFPFTSPLFLLAQQLLLSGPSFRSIYLLTCPDQELQFNHGRPLTSQANSTQTKNDISGRQRANDGLVEVYSELSSCTTTACRWIRNAIFTKSIWFLFHPVWNHKQAATLYINLYICPSPISGTHPLPPPPATTCAAHAAMLSCLYGFYTKRLSLA